MAIALLEEIEGNEAYFENDAIEGQNQGHISWGTPILVSTGVYRTSISGIDAVGEAIEGTTLNIEASTLPTPGEVFWAAAAALKALLCPSCV